MKSLFIIGVPILAMCQSAMSATWHYTPVFNVDAKYYFDADTVVKSGDSVDVWVKSVQMRVLHKDGSWATVLRYRFNCSKRTLQLLQWSDYNKDGEFMRSNSTPSSASEVTPDTIGEDLLKMSCSSGFPKKPTPNTYSPVYGNDIFKFTKDVTKMIGSKTDSAPK